MSDAEKKLTRARTELVLSSGAPMRFVASIVLKLPWVERDDAWWSAHAPWLDEPTMATDGQRIYYAKPFVEKLTLRELMAVIAHEGWHVALEHPLRRCHRHPVGWNIAADMRVNQIVTDMSLPLPGGCIPPEDDKGLSVEAIYAKLEKKYGGQGSKKGDGPQWGAVVEPQKGDGTPLTSEERAALEMETKQMIRAAANAARTAGKLPAGIEELLEDVLEPVVPWQAILARWVAQQSKNDYCWTRPSRRYLSQGNILPSLWTEDPPIPVVACDTSGSIDGKTLRQIVSDVFALVQHYIVKNATDFELPVLWFDHKVYEQRVSDPSELKPKGRGGTSFSIIFDHVEQMDTQPQGVVVITDGYCSDFGEAPDYEVLWILTQRNGGFKPPFGEVALVMEG